MLKPLSNTIHGVIDFTWPMVIISVIIMVSFRITYLIKNHEKIVIYKELSMLVFAVYILCLFQVVTFQDDASWASNNFIPFKEIMRYNITSRLFIKNVLGNMMMFLPFGFFASYYLKAEKKLLPLVLTIIASISIEVVQLVIGRVFDVDDILLNIVGGLIGYYAYAVLREINNKLPKVFGNEWVRNILVLLAASAVAVFIIMMYI